VSSCRRLAAITGFTLALTGCSQINRNLPINLYLAIGLEDSSVISEQNHRFFRDRISLVVNEFRKINPNIHLQVALYPESSILDRIQKRNQADLGPDLILTDAFVARELFERHLTVANPDVKALQKNIFPSLLQRVTTPQQNITGQPFVVYMQIACFNRRKIPRPPETTKELLEISAAGKNFGLSYNAAQIFWSAGSLGALPSLNRISGKQPINTADRRAITKWLAWLQQAGAQQRVAFFATQNDLKAGLLKGELDWITCASSSLAELRASLGKDLGVSTLPGGPRHAASPFNRLRVISLGENSSERQREAAIKLLNYMLQPQIQRNFTLQTLSFLPTNKHVKIPIKSSATLRAMVASRQQSDASSNFLNNVNLNQSLSDGMTDILTPLIFGLKTPEDSTDDLIAFLRRSNS
jgi:arabinogalactan oligomer/maltooligosaccharide transport system substrate-binding protein